ncbi:hypothetical protein CEXT_224241 [Caerostris extrusa]|uniref:Uncharacterized protein n=1 Tax=Caerostris extrusa TaxID=172846 RepID=A0AAV4P6P2_CAEEX|nr:hypothetical protein CEXT_224241 [Caerostris extrusa]
MKMPEKHDLLAAILAAKEQGIGAILAFAMAYLRGRYNGGQAIDRYEQYLGFTAGAGYGQFEHKADSLITKNSSGTVRD